MSQENEQNTRAVPIIYADNFGVMFTAVDGEIEFLFRNQKAVRIVVPHSVFRALAETMAQASGDMSRALGSEPPRLEEAQEHLRLFTAQQRGATN
jgi:hypothetical protein